MPPAALKPTLPSASWITASITAAASRVAPTSALPVEVFRKSQPAITAARAAPAIKDGSPRTPVSRITFSVVSLAAARQAVTSSLTMPMSPSRIAAMGATTSTSSAPAAAAAAHSSAARAMSSLPCGKLATVASRTPDPRSRPLACGTKRGQMQTAAVP